MTAGEVVPIASLLAAIGVLFGLLIRSLEKRAQDAIDRAVAVESENKGLHLEVRQAWEKTAELLAEANGKLSTMTQALIEQRRSTSGRN